MANPIKRAGSWRVQVKVGAVRESRTFGTKGEASAWARNRTVELKAADGREIHSLRDAFDRYSREVSPKKRGKKWEQLRLKALGKGPLGALDVAAVASDDIAAWRDARNFKVAGSTVRREMNLLRSVFGVAEREWRWRVGNPLAGVDRPVAPPARRRRVTTEEIDRICMALGYVPLETPVRPAHRVALAFLFALETAMRAGEILALRRKDLHLKDCYVELQTTKNGDARTVPLTPRAIQILKLFPLSTETVFDLNPESRDTLFRKARKRAQIEDLHFHDSRAEAIWRLSKRLDVLQLALVIGHRDINSLMFYYREGPADLAKRLA